MICVLTEKNNDALYALRHKVLREPLGLNLYEEDLATEHNQIAIGAFEKEVLVACLMLVLLPQDNCIKLRQMAVDPSFQGLGIGKKLMLFAHKFVQDKQIPTIILHARKSAQAFYSKLGYVCYGTEFLEVNIPHIAMRVQLI
jgi:predicted GNAT family N-acyltransferase